MTRILILALILLTTGCASAGSTGSTKTATLRDEGSVHIGKLKMTTKPVITSDRRIAAWGPLKANYIYLKVGLAWTFGMRHRLKDMYPDIR